MKDPRIIIALDYPDEQQALALIEQLDPKRCCLKVGKELFTCAGPQFVKQLVAQGFRVFLDLKFHDIPNTVAKACRAAAELGVWMINVHTLGGTAMLTAAREAVDQVANKPLLIGVTILTSLDEAALADIGLTGSVADNVSRLSLNAQQCGLDGVVCSAKEATMLREITNPDFCLVTPGIRPQGSASGDQQRVMTPQQAIAAGANYLVIGRPITQAPDPMAVIAAIEAEIE